MVSVCIKSIKIFLLHTQKREMEYDDDWKTEVGRSYFVGSRLEVCPFAVIF